MQYGAAWWLLAPQLGWKDQMLLPCRAEQAC